jgi:zinc transport system substrate-binding protein
MLRGPPHLLAVLVAGALVLVSCSPSTPTGESGDVAPAIQVVASFYPLEWMADQVGGDRVGVESLAPPGAEPHDLELSPADVATVADADLVVFLSGFQPAVDQAVGGAGGTLFDAADFASLDRSDASIEAGRADPHFWLDPMRMADVADALAVALGEVDPEGAEVFARNASELREELIVLDDEFTAGLASCEDTDLVTSHNAFGYLADRFGLRQVGISGLTPDEEPSPGDLAAVADFVRENGVTTIYFETLVSPAVAETLAAEVGAETAALDPLEGLSEASDGGDYFEVMRSNLTTLRAGQSCL